MQLKCPTCGSEFQRKPSYIAAHPPPLFCSKPCRWSIEDRFWKYVQKSGYCWIWIGANFCKGYGQLMVNNRRIAAHRMSWILAGNQIPKGLGVLHHCDNRRCVRPDHLFLGTAKDNAQDASNKGRLRRGLSHHNSVFMEEDIKKIRTLFDHGEKQIAIAKRFGVSTSCVSKIVNRKLWNHVH